MGLLPMDLDILPPSDNRIFKLLLTSPEAKPGLMNLISGVIGRKVVDVDVFANEPPAGDTEEKAERFDVNCKIDDGSQINLDMQAIHIQEEPGGQHLNLKGKSVYYLTDLHSSQPAKGKLRFDRLARTYQITFCSYTIFPEGKDYMNSFSLRHDTTGELLCDAIQLVFVELSKLTELLDKPVGEMSALDKWSLFFQYAADPAHRKKVNEVIQSEKVLSAAGDLLIGISQNEEERARFRSRKKFLTDLQSDLETAKDSGRAEGIDIGKREIAKNLFKTNLSLFEIADATGLPIEEVRRLRAN